VILNARLPQYQNSRQRGRLDTIWRARRLLIRTKGACRDRRCRASGARAPVSLSYQKGERGLRRNENAKEKSPRQRPLKEGKIRIDPEMEGGGGYIERLLSYGDWIEQEGGRNGHAQQLSKPWDSDGRTKSQQRRLTFMSEWFPGKKEMFLKAFNVETKYYP